MTIQLAFCYLHSQHCDVFAVVIGLVSGAFQLMGSNISGGFMAIGGGLFAGMIIGFAPQWGSSTVQTLTWFVNHAVTLLASPSLLRSIL